MNFLKLSYRKFDEAQFVMEDLLLDTPEIFPDVPGSDGKLRMMQLVPINAPDGSVVMPEGWIWFTYDDKSVTLLTIDLPDDPSFMLEDEQEIGEDSENEPD